MRRAGAGDVLERNVARLFRERVTLFEEIQLTQPSLMSGKGTLVWDEQAAMTACPVRCLDVQWNYRGLPGCWPCRAGLCSWVQASWTSLSRARSKSLGASCQRSLPFLSARSHAHQHTAATSCDTGPAAAAIVRSGLKSMVECVRLVTLGRAGLQQLQVDVHYLRSRLRRSASHARLG